MVDTITREPFAVLGELHGAVQAAYGYRGRRWRGREGGTEVEVERQEGLCVAVRWAAGE